MGKKGERCKHRWLLVGDQREGAMDACPPMLQCADACNYYSL